MAMKIRFDVLAKYLKAAPLDGVPFLFRTTVIKVIDALADTGQMRTVVVPTKTGLSSQTRLDPS